MVDAQCPLHLTKCGPKKWRIMNTKSELFTGTDKELNQILLQSIKSQSYQGFGLKMECLGMPLTDEVIADLKQQYALCLVPPVQSGPEPKIDPSIKLDDLLQNFVVYRQREFEVIACVIASDKMISCPTWLAVISPPSTGKTHLLQLFEHPCIAMLVDDFTENAIAPGRPNVDAAKVKSMLDDAARKNLILQDMSSVFGMKADKVNSFLSSLTAAYGSEYRKYSPGDGNQIHEGHLTVIMGMTPQSYRKHQKYMTTIGNRFFFFKMYRPEHMGFRDAPDIDIDVVKEQVCSFIWTHWGYKEIKISTEIDDYIYDFAHKIILLRGIRWARSWSEVEGESRLLNELRELCRSRAKLHDRTEVLKEDMDFFKPLAYETIPNISNLYTIYRGMAHTHHKNKWTKIILDNCIHFKMVQENKRTSAFVGFDKKESVTVNYEFTQEWHDFCYPILENLSNSYIEEEEQDTESMPESKEENEFEKKKNHFLQICSLFESDRFTMDDVKASLNGNNYTNIQPDDIPKMLLWLTKNNKLELVDPSTFEYSLIKGKKKESPKSKEKPKPKTALDIAAGERP